MQSIRAILLSALCLLAITGFARQQPTLPSKPVPQKEKAEEEKLFVKVEIEANTNPYEWEQHLKKGIRLADSILNNLPAGQYTAVILFIVDKEGKMTGVKLETDPGYGLGQIAWRIVNSYTGEWKPAVQCGRAVKAYLRQQVKFIVQE